MSLLTESLKAFTSDPPREVRQLGEQIRTDRQVRIERDCYERELIRLGYTRETLKIHVQLFDRMLKEQVRMGQVAQ